MTNTKEILESNNTNFDGTVGEKEVQIAQAYELFIERSRSGFRPLCGDLFIDEKGVSHHIEAIEDDGSMSLCQGYMTPFVSVTCNSNGNAHISTNTSGGPWSRKEVTRDITLLKDKKLRTFCFFFGGMRAHGALTIVANVNVWTYNK